MKRGEGEGLRPHGAGSPCPRSLTRPAFREPGVDKRARFRKSRHTNHLRHRSPPSTLPHVAAHFGASGHDGEAGY